MNAPDPQLAAQLRARAEAVQARTLLSSVIGGDVRLTKAGAEHDGLCPFHADTKTGSFKVNDKLGLYKCFSCGAAGDAIKYLMLRKGLTFGQALNLLEADAGIDFRDAKQRVEFDRLRERRDREAADDAERKRLSAFHLWLHAAMLAGTPAESYLRGRGIDFAKLEGNGRALRFRHDCWNSEVKRPVPAMVAAMVLNGKHAATHRTYLELVGGKWVKARLDQPKMTLGKFMGAHIPLNKGAAGRMPLHLVPAGTVPFVSEGIEDGLTVAMADPTLRVVAAATLGNIGAIVLPDTVKEITIIGQHDRPFSAADVSLEKQIRTHQAAGRMVDCIWPGPGFKDFNDELRGVRMGAA